MNTENNSTAQAEIDEIVLMTKNNIDATLIQKLTLKSRSQLNQYALLLGIPFRLLPTFHLVNEILQYCKDLANKTDLKTTRTLIQLTQCKTLEMKDIKIKEMQLLIDALQSGAIYFSVKSRCEFEDVAINELGMFNMHIETAGEWARLVLRQDQQNSSLIHFCSQQIYFEF